MSALTIDREPAGRTRPSAVARGATAWQVVRVTLVGTVVLSLLVSDGLLRWTEERLDWLTPEAASAVDAVVRGYDGALQRLGVGTVHRTLRAWIRDIEAWRFSRESPEGESSAHAQAAPRA